MFEVVNKSEKFREYNCNFYHFVKFFCNFLRLTTFLDLIEWAKGYQLVRIYRILPNLPKPPELLVA